MALFVHLFRIQQKKVFEIVFHACQAFAMRLKISISIDTQQQRQKTVSQRKAQANMIESLWKERSQGQLAYKLKTNGELLKLFTVFG